MPPTKLETVLQLLKEAEQELVELMERIHNLKMVERIVREREKENDKT